MPPLVTDINLSLDDRFLYVSCWGTGELRQYDVSDPFNPELTGSRADRRHRRSRPRIRSKPDKPLNGGPQMVEVSRDGRRVYLTNSLYRDLGRPVLSRRHSRLDGEARCQAERRHGVRPELPARDRRAAPAPGAARRAATLRPIRTASREVDHDGHDELVVGGLLALGAFHGVNPGHGVAVRGGARHAGAPPRRGLARDAAAGARARAGDCARRSAVAMLVGAVVPLRAMQWSVGGVLLVLGISRFFRHAHPRWVGMRVGLKDLTVWSFLMASAHGAGLMVLPLVLGGGGRPALRHAGRRRRPVVGGVGDARAQRGLSHRQRRRSRWSCSRSSASDCCARRGSISIWSGRSRWSSRASRHWRWPEDADVTVLSHFEFQSGIGRRCLPTSARRWFTPRPSPIGPRARLPAGR